MTLEEFIAELKKGEKCNASECYKDSCNDCEHAFDMNKMPTTKEILLYFEELKELREKYKNVSEAYMKCNLELYRLTIKNDLRED